MHLCRGRSSDRATATRYSSRLCLGALPAPAWPSLLLMLISFLLLPIWLCSWLSDPPFIFRRCSLSPGLIVATCPLVVRLAPTPSQPASVQGQPSESSRTITYPFPPPARPGLSCGLWINTSISGWHSRSPSPYQFPFLTSSSSGHLLPARNHGETLTRPHSESFLHPCFPNQARDASQVLPWYLL